jgi:hypothetical protein
MLLTLYDPRRFYKRVLDSLEYWHIHPEQRASVLSLLYRLRVIFKSVWRQGVLSAYRSAYWHFMGCLMFRWGLDLRKRQLGFELALSGHHFINYARQVAETLESESLHAVRLDHPEIIFQTDGPAANLVRIDGVRPK